MPVPWSLPGWRPLPNFIPRIIHQGPASPTYVLPPSTEPIWQNWAKKALKIWPFNLLLFNQLRKISYLIKKHSKTTKTWKYNLLLNVYILELVLLHHHLWPFQVSPNSSQCGIGLEGILKSQQAEVVTVARQIVTEDLEALSIYSVEGRVCLSLSQPPLLLFYCSWRRVQSCCNMQVFKVKDIVYKR